MCLGTFSRLRRSLATSTLYAAVRILAERLLLYRKAISCKVTKPRLNIISWDIKTGLVLFTQVTRKTCFSQFFTLFFHLLFRNLLLCHSNSISAVFPFLPDLAVLGWSRCRHLKLHWLQSQAVSLRILLPVQSPAQPDSCPVRSS